MNILQRGTVVNLGGQKVVVLLEAKGNHGWDCLCISDIPSSVYYRQNIFVFYEDLKAGTIIKQLEV